MLSKPFTLIELTHVLTSESPTWNGSCGFHLEIKKDYDQTFRVQQIKMHAGIGTHMDAPSHCNPDGRSIAEIPLEQFILPACVIDVSLKAGADYEISVEDIENHERKHGIIPQGSLVLGHTGWSRFWAYPSAYRNVDETGQMHFPAFSRQAAAYLLTRDIAALAIDTLSPDCLDRTFPVHQMILGAGKYIIENVADCAALPERGAYVIALPLRAHDATESPIRLIGIVPPSLQDS